MVLMEVKFCGQQTPSFGQCSILHNGKDLFINYISDREILCKELKAMCLTLFLEWMGVWGRGKVEGMGGGEGVGIGIDM